MARRSHDGYSNSSDDNARDVTAQFWGSSPAWRTTGSHPRARRNGERTGRVARTRRHGDRTGQIPAVPTDAVEEPLIDPYDFGFDDVGYALEPGIAGRRVDTMRRAPLDVPAVEQPEFVELIELDEHPQHGSGDPVSTLAERLGLGAVDPLLFRLGAIVMIGVLLVPVAMSSRGDADERTVRTEVVAAPSAALVAPIGEPVVEVAPTLDTPSAGDSTTANESSNSVAPAPTTSPQAAAASATDRPEAASGGSDVAQPADDSPSDIAEAAQKAPSTSQSATEAAEADEPANRVAPVCHLSYTVAAGDYWIRISEAAGTSLAQLLQANLATVMTPLYPGDDICLPEGATVPASPTTATTSPPPTTPPTTSAPTTTAAPTTSAPPVTAPPAPGAIQDIIREVWPDELEDKALEIAWRESGYQPGAHNWCCYGLFQIHWNAHQGWLDDFGVTSATQLFDARTNARAAYALYQRSGGWGPWGG
jgi:LysM repeat protein